MREMKLKHDISDEEISVAAYYIWEKKHPYDILCWLLAERQLYVEQNFTHPSDDLISKVAEKIFFSQTPHDVLCWYIGLYDLFIKKKTKRNDIDLLFQK